MARKFHGSLLVTFTAVAFALIPLCLIEEAPFFHLPLLEIYQWIVPGILLLMFLWWGAKRSTKNLLAALGFRWSKRWIAIGFVAGVLTSALLWYTLGWRLRLGDPFFPIYGIIILPAAEEILFRGFLLNRSFYSNRAVWVFVIIASILIFAWVHPAYPHEKVIFGVVLTSIYVLSGNIDGAVVAHAGANAALWVLAGMSFGPAAIWAVLMPAVSAFFLLLIAMRKIEQIAYGIARAWQKLPRRR